MYDTPSATGERPAILGGPPVFPDGPPPWPVDDPAIAAALASAAADGSWGQYHGGHCQRLAELLANFHQCEHVLLCSSGTAAVELALRGLGIGPGDEVILGAYDFKGNFQDVLAVGAQPFLIDVAESNWNLDPAGIEPAIGPATKAVIVSHLHGGVVNMPAVMEISTRRNLRVIEDACQMTGGMVAGKRAGTWGHVGVLSFGGSKLLTAGRGGALLTNDAQIFQRARLYSHRGNEAYPLAELQAAVLVPQLEKLEVRNARRLENVAGLCRLLSALPGLVPFDNGALDCEPCYYKLGLKFAAEAMDGLSRDQFVAALRAEGVAVDAGFRALHLIHSARRYRQAGELLIATLADRAALVLHHPILLGAESDLENVARAFGKVVRHAAEILEVRRAAPADQ